MVFPCNDGCFFHFINIEIVLLSCAYARMYCPCPRTPQHLDTRRNCCCSRCCWCTVKLLSFIHIGQLHNVHTMYKYTHTHRMQKIHMKCKAQCRPNLIRNKPNDSSFKYKFYIRTCTTERGRMRPMWLYCCAFPGTLWVKSLLCCYKFYAYCIHHVQCCYRTMYVVGLYWVSALPRIYRGIDSIWLRMAAIAIGTTT